MKPAYQIILEKLLYYGSLGKTHYVFKVPMKPAY
jgi:hypothetical protein